MLNLPFCEAGRIQYLIYTHMVRMTRANGVDIVELILPTVGIIIKLYFELHHHVHYFREKI